MLNQDSSLAAKGLADATGRIVEAAKVHPATYSQAIYGSFNEVLPSVMELLVIQTMLKLKKLFVEQLKISIMPRILMLMMPSRRSFDIKKLQMAASATQCIAAAQGATPTSSNQSSQQQLLTNCKMVADQIGKLVQV